MKKFLVLVLFCVCSFAVSAKKVMFQVDMTGITVMPTGMHITGDFQLAAGFGGNNFDCNVMTMTKAPDDSNLYQLLVDIPAFQKYEFMFVNGDQCYEVEFVPLESRANYNFSDYRWIFIDSLANDTTVLAPLRFSQNAPAGKTLVRFKVNMQNETAVSPAGVHVAGDFQSWMPYKDRLYSFANNLYEWIAYVDTGNFVFRYYNGNIAANAETVPTSCANNNGDRFMYVTQDTVLDILCYASCTLCFPSNINDIKTSSNFTVYPNPNSGTFTIDIPSKGKFQCFDITGRIVDERSVETGKQTIILPQTLNGLFQVRLLFENGSSAYQKVYIR